MSAWLSSTLWFCSIFWYFVVLSDGDPADISAGDILAFFSRAVAPWSTPRHNHNHSPKKSVLRRVDPLDHTAVAHSPIPGASLLSLDSIYFSPPLCPAVLPVGVCAGVPGGAGGVAES